MAIYQPDREKQVLQHVRAIASEHAGRVASRRARHGDAPRAAALSPREAFAWATAGATIRTTKGIATRAWAIGTSHGEARRSSGGRSNATTNPKPSVTADTPSGTATRAHAPRRRAEPAQLLHLAGGEDAAARWGGGADHLPVHDGRAQPRCPPGDRLARGRSGRLAAAR